MCLGEGAVGWCACGKLDVTASHRPPDKPQCDFFEPFSFADEMWPPLREVVRKVKRPLPSDAARAGVPKTNAPELAKHGDTSVDAVVQQREFESFSFADPLAQSDPAPPESRLDKCMPCAGSSAVAADRLSALQVHALRALPVRHMFVHFPPERDDKPRAKSSPAVIENPHQWLRFIQIGWSGGTTADGAPHNLFKECVRKLGCVYWVNKYTYFMRIPEHGREWLEDSLTKIAVNLNAMRPKDDGSHSFRRNKRTRVRVLTVYHVGRASSEDAGWQALLAAWALVKEPKA